MVLTVWRISLAAAGSGILRPKCLSSATTNCSASTESKPRLPGPNNGWSSAMSIVVTCSMRFSTIMLLIRCFSAFTSSMVGSKNAAVHFQYRACNVTGFRTSQKSNRGSDFFRSAEAAHGNTGLGGLAFLLRHRGEGPGLDIAGADRIHGDADTGDLLGERL